MIKAGIIGATGYAGVELVRLLLSHPVAEPYKLASVSYEGQALSAHFPAFTGELEETLVSPEEVIESCDVVFASVPHGVSEAYAAACIEQGKKFIDLGADFRLDSEEAYSKWYGGAYENKALHAMAVYGLPELYRAEIRETSLVANPGCYPTSAALGLAPALRAGLVSADGIIISSASGVTGAGRGLSQGTHYPDMNESFHPYKIGAHRHTPEIEENLSKLAGTDVKVTFVPHLLPVNRGIVSTIYAKRGAHALSDIFAAYQAAYAKEPFVKVLPLGQIADLKNVRMSNYCHISLHEDEHTGMLIIVSAIDNMVKGAAGQAIQNMNLICGLAEDAGLRAVAPAI